MIILLENVLDFSLICMFENRADRETELAPRVVAGVNWDVLSVLTSILTTGLVVAAVIAVNSVMLFQLAVSKLSNTTLCYLLVFEHLIYA